MSKTEKTEDITYNKASFVCPICSLYCKAADGIVLKNCHHTFCLECVANHVHQSQGKVISCLHTESPGTSVAARCYGVLQEIELRHFVSPYVMKKRFPELLLQKDDPKHNCLSNGCTGSLTQFDCSICGKINCISCKAIHEFQTCEDYLTKLEKKVNVVNEDVVWSTTDPFTCPICFEDYDAGEGIILRGCFHIFCFECIKSHMMYSTTMEIQCPYMDYNYTCCKQLFLNHEIINFISTEDYLTRLLPMGEQTEQNIFNCQTPNCFGWCFVEENITQFMCSNCGKENCIICKAIHEFKTCDDYWTDILDKKSPVYSDLIEMHDSADFVPNIELFACPICFVDYDTGEGIILRECLHVFCFDCIRSHIMHSTDVEIKCPFMDDQYSCDSFLQEREIKHFVKPDEYNKYLTRSLQVAEQTIQNTFHCLTPNCLGWCVVEDNAVQFICCICRRDNCLSCKVIHEGKTCNEYLQSTTSYKITEANNLSKEALNAMIANGQAMLCPTCQAVIEKISGCDSIACTACKTHLCWATRGRRWGPAGVGDTSGGCRCGVAGKCHPNCKNCH